MPGRQTGVQHLGDQGVESDLIYDAIIDHHLSIAEPAGGPGGAIHVSLIREAVVDHPAQHAVSRSCLHGRLVASDGDEDIRLRTSERVGLRDRPTGFGIVVGGHGGDGEHIGLRHRTGLRSDPLRHGVGHDPERALDCSRRKAPETQFGSVEAPVEAVCMENLSFMEE